MTVVAARKYEHHIEFAADSITTYGSMKMNDRIVDTPKLFSQNGLMIGLTGRASEGALMQIFCRNHKPMNSSIEGIIDFLFEFEGWVQKRESSFRLCNQYLIGYDGRLFRTFSGLDVFEVPEYAAIGAGEDFAITAMCLGKNPREAVAIACHLSVWCSEPITELQMAIG